MTDSIIETKICPISGQEFTITQWDLDFYDKISPTFAGQKFQIPTPTLHPEERQRRRLSFRNERNLYRRKCDASGKDIISIYKPTSPLSKGDWGGFVVYDQKIRRSDARDPLDYGQDFDFSKTFKENFRELMQKVPRQNLIWANNENSDYVNLTADSKNCYIVIESSNAENCLYGYWLQRCTNCTDSNFCESCESCYEIDNCFRSYQCYYSVNLEDCSNCWYSNSCINCSFCYGCVSLQNQSYCIYNKLVSKEEYFHFLQSHHEKIDFTNIRSKYPESKNQIKLSEGSTGNYLRNTKNCIDCIDWYEAEDCKYGEHIRRNAKNCMDVSTAGRDAEMIYECINTGINVYYNISSMVCRSSHHILYSDNCFNSDNLFWCIGLRNKSYCIFNKQYTKEEYELTVSKIISHMITTEEWWEFFHPSLSPFGYNETVAQEYYPLGKAASWKLQAIKQETWNLQLEAWSPNWFESFGYHRSDYQSPTPAADKILEGKDLPATIDEVSDDILKTAIKCEITEKLFRIIPQELAFYRKHNIPLPRRHPDQRHLDRLALRK